MIPRTIFLLMVTFCTVQSFVLRPQGARSETARHPLPRRVPLQALAIEKETSSIALIDSSVVYAPSHTQADVKAWKKLVPRLYENPRGIDETVDWTASERPYDVAGRWMQQAGLSEIVLQRNLETSMKAFQDFCEKNLSSSSGKKQSYSARIVASRGAPGTKCPIWHLDHVPVRWIQALAGPGCQWIRNNEAIQWDRINNLDDNLTGKERNKLLIDADTAVVEQAAEGKAVLLLGNKWKDHCNCPSALGLRPAVHKSPDDILPWQGRVLLTMDVHL